MVDEMVSLSPDQPEVVMPVKQTITPRTRGKKANKNGQAVPPLRSLADEIKQVTDGVRPYTQRDVFCLPPDDIYIEKGMNPRQVFDKDELNRMAATIRHIGVLHPLVVHKRNDKYFLVGGERRLKACRIAGLKEVPVRLFNGTDSEIEYARLVENMYHVHLHPLEEARGFAGLLGKEITLYDDKNGKRTVTINAKVLSDLSKLSQSYISQRLALLDLPKEIQHALLINDITFAQAREIRSAEDHAAQMIIFKKIIDGKMSRAVDVKQTLERQRAQKALKSDEEEKPRRGRPPQTDVTLPNITKQVLETALDRLRTVRIKSRTVGEIRESVATLYERHEKARSDERKQQLRGAIAYAEWIAGFKDSF